MSLNLADRFFERAERQPDTPLILGPAADVCLSFAAFADGVEALAQGLRDAGVGAGDNVGLHFPSNGAATGDYIAFVYALWRCRASVTPLPYELTSTEQREILETVHLDALVIAEARADACAPLIAGTPVKLGRNAIFARPGIGAAPPPRLDGINPAFIRFTSGTTGTAKGVVLSHESIHARIHAANERLRIGPRDRVLWLLSLDYHFAVSICAYLTFGAGIVLPRNAFGESLLAAANEQQATLIYGAPAHYALMTQDDTGAGLPAGLRAAIVTTTALPREIADAFRQRFGRVLNETYGIIELGLPAINLSQDPAKQGAVGPVLPDYELRLDCAPGQAHGEVLLRGTGMLDAYYAPYRPRELILQDGDGWFHTGDLGRLDADGFLYIVGRSKEVISVGGMKFFPTEVEAVLEQHPAVAAACVFAPRSEQAWQPVHAQLVAAEGAARPAPDELKAHCRQCLAAHKVPAKLSWVPALAFTPSGKKVRDPERLRHHPERLRHRDDQDA